MTIVAVFALICSAIAFVLGAAWGGRPNSDLMDLEDEAKYLRRRVRELTEGRQRFGVLLDEIQGVAVEWRNRLGDVSDVITTLDQKIGVLVQNKDLVEEEVEREEQGLNRAFHVPELHGLAQAATSGKAIQSQRKMAAD